MPDMFKSLADVDAYVRQDATGNGKAMLGVQLALGTYFDTPSRELAEAWIAKDDARLAVEAAVRREKDDRDLRVREVAASEKQAVAAERSTLVAWLAFAVSVAALAVSIWVYIRPPAH